jgi:hypothetical protein
MRRRKIRDEIEAVRVHRYFELCTVPFQPGFEVLSGVCLPADEQLGMMRAVCRPKTSLSL